MPTKTRPWNKPRPAQKTGRKLTEAEKERARERAAKAGRRYPNLIDNMIELKKRR